MTQDGLPGGTEPIWSKLPVDQALAELKTSSRGLAREEAERRLGEHGPNSLKEKKPESLLWLFLHQFFSPLIYILIFAAVVSLLVGKAVNAAVIGLVLLVNALLGFIQESRARKVMAAIRQLSAPKARVMRDGQAVDIISSEIVPGEIVLLEAGSKVPADGRVIESVRLQVNESSLTGESQPVHKITEPLPEDRPLAERVSMVYAGTTVVSGRGAIAVITTGMATEVGKIAQMLSEEPEAKTPFQKRMEGFGRLVVVIVLAQVGLAFLIGRLVRGLPFYDIFLVAISQMVSSIPEGLPVAITVALAVGMQRMAEKKTYIRRLAAVEGLGSATVICSDKTGTLTRNEMTSKMIALPGRDLEISGSGYETAGELTAGGQKIVPEEEAGLQMLLRTAALCNNADLKGKTGDPTEVAYLVLARKAGLDLEQLDREFPRVDELPFESELQLMLTAHRTPEGNSLVCVKGAPERVLGLCRFHGAGESRLDVDPAFQEQVKGKVAELAGKALRVLAFAYVLGDHNGEISYQAIEQKMVFAGLIGNIDPPRPEARDAIAKCRRAGIRVIMATGDHLLTAEAIAAELGIGDGRVKGLTGEELEKLSGDALLAAVREHDVFARVEPKHKHLIVKALQERGDVVAMTGDGVNDAPALAAADIGVAMGITGTDVAKEASAMVIADDNFATIVDAVEEGRGINDNMRRTVLYLLCSSNTEILVLLAALLTGLPLPLLPLMILWINLVADGALTVNLIMEPKENVMDRPPAPQNEPIVNGHLLRLMLFRVPIMAAGVLGLFIYELWNGQPLAYARTAAFTVLAVTQWANGLNCRSDRRSLFGMSFLTNRYLLFGLIAAVSLQLLISYLPFTRQVFELVFLSWADWLKIILVGGVVLAAEELRKLFIRSRQ